MPSRSGVSQCFGSWSTQDGTHRVTSSTMDGIKPRGLMRCARVACLSWDTRLVAGIPVCATHGRELVAEVSTVEVARAEEWAKRLPTREPIGSVVLYVQIGGNVHIGWSVDPAGH